MLRVLTIVSAAAILAACATTNDAATEPDAPLPAEAAGEQQVAELDEVVCRRLQVTGTRFPERVCKTRREWAAESQPSGDATRELSRRYLQQNPDGS